MSLRQTTLAPWRSATGRKNQISHQTKDIINNRTQLDNTYTTPPNQQCQLIQQHILSPRSTNMVWGHRLPEKDDGIFRLGLRNINSLPLSKNHSKNELFINDIIAGAFDIFCATEVNLAWHNLPYQDRIKERFKGSLEFAKFVTATNKDKELKEPFQRGGTMTICSGPICARTVDAGCEKHVLGRWSWIKVRGCQGLTLIVATLYRPVTASGALSTYQQHKSVLMDNNIDECPRENILVELGKQIRIWLDEGHQIIITGDFNEDIRSGRITSFFNEFRMSELILKQHGQNAPNTYINGVVPIDGIFATEGIQPIYSGYTAFSWGMYSDHRLIWVDLDMTHILGSKAPPMWKPKARRLQCNNPLVVKKFNKLRLQHMQSNNILKKLSEFESSISDTQPMNV
jgi:hypothetical protein